MGTILSHFMFANLRRLFSTTMSSSSSLDLSSKVVYEVHGYASCGYYQNSKSIAKAAEKSQPDLVEAKIVEHSTRSSYKASLASVKSDLVSDNNRHASHTSSPLVVGYNAESPDSRIFIGGNDDFEAHLAANSRL